MRTCWRSSRVDRGLPDKCRHRRSGAPVRKTKVPDRAPVVRQILKSSARSIAMHRSLDPFFKPETVAVIGASATPGSVGQTVMRNLARSDFNGVVFPINPQRRAVFGMHCYPN